MNITTWKNPPKSVMVPDRISSECGLSLDDLRAYGEVTRQPAVDLGAYEIHFIDPQMGMDFKDYVMSLGPGVSYLEGYYGPQKDMVVTESMSYALP